MLHTPASPYASSSVASTYEVKSAPPPPHSAGTHTPKSPRAPARRTVSSGTVAGVLPGFSRRDANRWVTIPIVTGMDQARNVVLVRSCDAVIAVGGSYGTLSEIALALKLGVPVVGLSTWRLAPPEARRVPLIRARSADDAVRLAVSAARRHGGRTARTWLS